MGEMVHGGLVSYLVNKEDIEKLPPEQISGEDEIFEDEDREIPGIEPSSRLRLRRYTHRSGDFDLAIPEEDVYGQYNSEFMKQVTEWCVRSRSL